MSTTVLGELAVKLTAPSSDFNRSFDQAASKMEEFQKIGERMAKISGAAFAGLAGAIGIATRSLEGQRQAETKLAAAIRATGAAIDASAIGEYAAELQKVTTFGDEATISAAAMMVPLVQSEAAIKSLLPHVQDLAAFMGGDLHRAAINVGRAIAEGTTGPLMEMGVVLSEAEKEMFKVGDTMARTALLSEKIGMSVGGMAEAMANTAGGAAAQLQGVFGDLLEELGKITEAPLVLTMHAARDAIAEVTAWVSSLSAEAKHWLGVGALVATGLAGIGTALGTMLYLLPGVIAGFEALGVTSLPALTPILLTIGAIAAAITGVILVVGSLKKAWDADFLGMRTTIKSFLEDVEAWWGKSVKWLGDTFRKALDWISEKFVLISSWVSGASPDEAYATLAAARAGGGVFDVGAGSGFADMAGEIKRGASSAIAGIKDVFMEGVRTLGLDKLGSALGDLLPEVGGLTEQASGAAEALGGLGEKAESVGEVVDLGTIYVDPEVMTSEWDTAGKQVADAALGLAQGFGDAGDLLSGFMQGFAQGGPIGAIIGVLTALLTKLEFFSEVMEIVNNDLGVLFSELSDAFGFITDTFSATSEMLQPVFRALGDVLRPVGEILEMTIWPVLSVMAPVLEIISGLLKVLATILLGVQVAFGWVLNAVLDLGKAFLDVLDSLTFWESEQWIKDAKRKLDRAKVDISDEAVLREFDRIWNPTEATEGSPLDETVEATLETNDAMRELSKSVRAVNQELLNVPSGFKIALSRFHATDVGATQGAPGGGNTYVSVRAYDASHFAKELGQIERYGNMVLGGSTAGRVGPYATPRNGA